MLDNLLFHINKIHEGAINLAAKVRYDLKKHGKVINEQGKLEDAPHKHSF